MKTVPEVKTPHDATADFLKEVGKLSMKEQLDVLLMGARREYEAAKIRHNEGRCTAETLEGLRKALEKLESLVNGASPQLLKALSNRQTDKSKCSETSAKSL